MNEHGSVYVPPPGTEMRLVDPDNGVDAEVGEIWLRGPAAATGWTRTGDLARRGAAGHVTTIGRCACLISA